MGVKMLNRFLKDKTRRSMKWMRLNELNGCKIAVDIYIYLYQFKKNGMGLKGVYEMCSLFLKNNVTPVFVFDGMPPKEKWEIIKERNDKKKKAWEELVKLEDLMKNMNNNLMETKMEETKMEKKKMIENKIISLKQKSIKLDKKFVENSKDIIKTFGLSLVVAKGEADELCCQMVNTGKVFACITEDMDLFPLGCKKVIRHFDLKKTKILVYNYDSILEELNLTKEQFKSLCILSGTDFNKNKKTIYQYYNLLLDYKYYNIASMTFYEWLLEMKNIDLDINKLLEIEKIYDTNHTNSKYVLIKNKPYNKYKAMKTLNVLNNVRMRGIHVMN